MKNKLSSLVEDIKSTAFIDKQKDNLDENTKIQIKRWRYYGLYLTFGPILFIHFIKWIATDVFSLRALCTDVLLLGFSYYVTFLNFIMEMTTEKNKAEELRFFYAINAGIFMVIYLIYSIVDGDATRYVILAIVLLYELCCVIYAYIQGIKLKIFKISGDSNE